MIPSARRWLPVAVVLALTTATAARAPQTLTLVDAIGARVESYYERLTAIACTEVVTQQELRRDMKPRGKPREFVYDLIVTREPATTIEPRPRIRAERQIRSRNGKPVRQGERPGCTDPQPQYTDPLSFLLRENRGGYRFNPTVGPTLVLEFAELQATATKVFWKDNCFTADGGRTEGRLVADPFTHDVVRLETRLVEPFDVPGPKTPTVALAFPTQIVERYETVVRFRRVGFANPDETLLLPESIETIQVVSHAETPRLKTTQLFKDFRRFMTQGKIAK